jgi:putative hydrolase of the HAD superfamily
MTTRQNPLSIKALIFDYGGTLDTGGDHWFHLLWEAYRRAGAPFGEETFRDAYIHGERALGTGRMIHPSDDFPATLVKKCRLHLEYCLSHHLIAPDDSAYEPLIAEVAADCDRTARLRTRESRVILEPLAKRHPMVVLSNHYGNLDRVLAAYGLDTLFIAAIDSARIGIRKPDPALLSIAIGKTGCDPGEIAVVGDSFENDIVPALALGCRAFWLKGRGWQTGGVPADPAIPGQVRVIGSLKELPGALE